MRFLPFIVAAAASIVPVFAAAQLQAPFAQRAPSDPAKAARSCGTPATPVIAITVSSKYGNDGPLRDTIDSAADAESAQQMAPLRSFSRAVVKAANNYTRSGNPGDAVCALSWLNSWAEAGAMAQVRDANGQFARASTLAGLGLALLQIAPAVGSDPRYARVSGWMHALASDSAAYFDGSEKLKGSRNNHRDWAALAVATSAVASNDSKLLAWSARSYNTAVCGATPDGALPLELARGKKARDYHLFALSALVPLAAIIESNGEDAFGACDGALGRIVDFSLASIGDPGRMAALAGKEQAPFPGGRPSNSQLAFLEAWHSHAASNTSARIAANLKKPLVSTNLGGDQSLLYAR